MSLRRILRPTNTRLRLGVGLVLAGLFCIQCTRSDAVRDRSYMGVVSGQAIGEVPAQQIRRLEQLAAEDHLRLLALALENYRDSYQDYTCTFIKQERINGQLRPAETVEVKYLEKPFCVSMRWMENAPIAERILYVNGKHGGQMLVQPKGLLGKLVGTVKRSPDSADVRANTLRPVTAFGFRRMMESLREVYKLAADRREGSFRFNGYQQVAGRRALRLERVLPPENDYPAATTLWYLDVEYLVPLALESYDWDGRLICQYVFKDVRFNVGLTEDDFSPEANDMKLKQ